MGKMKEIAQISITWRPSIKLEDILDPNEYKTFLQNFTIRDNICWTVSTQKIYGNIFDKINDVLLVKGFKPNDIVYLES